MRVWINLQSLNIKEITMQSGYFKSGSVSIYYELHGEGEEILCSFFMEMVVTVKF